MRYVPLVAFLAAIPLVICFKSHLDPSLVAAFILLAAISAIITALVLLQDRLTPKTAPHSSTQKVDERPSEITEHTSDVAPQGNANEFLQVIAGAWHLEYERRGTMNSEECFIDANGNYYRLPDRRRVYAKLENVEYDPKHCQVQFLKRRLRRPARSQTEILTIKEKCTEMVGHAEHDGHSLKYTRPSDRTVKRFGGAGPEDIWRQTDN